VERLRWQLDVDPALLVVVRGVDVASRELAVPGWLVGPLLTDAREGSLRPSAYLSRLCPDIEVPPLRVTAHAGEDFRSLHEGIRRIHELFPCMREGDRVGHGMALALPPDEWARRARGARQPREERLWDLVWECSLYERGDVAGSGARIAWVHEQIRSVFDVLMNSDREADGLARARRLGRQLLDGTAFTRLAYPDPWMAPPPPQPDLEALFRYLSDSSVFRRATEGVDVPTGQDEVQALVAMQHFVREQLARREITVEVNPSSNLIIGDLASIQDHPAFQLACRHRMPAEQPRVAVTLSDDDPLTFATCLADEYAYMYAAMLRDDIPSAQALAWLEEARAAAWTARFTIRASAFEDVRRGFRAAAWVGGPGS
jgi:hypothetical protein